MRALSTMIFLYDKKFKTEERRELYVSILFDTMKDASKRLRLYAYDILKDYYQMKEFTPKKDSVLDMLSQEGVNVEEYQQAAQAFEDRIRSMQVVPMDREFIAKWLKQLPHNPPTIPVEECDICKDIPERSSADMMTGESLDIYTDKLDVAVRFGYYKNKILRCPICGQFYKYEYEYEFLVPCSEEDEYLARINHTKVMKAVDEILKYHSLKQIITCGNFLKMV